MRLYYSPDYVLAAHSFDTTRKSGWIAESLVKDPIAGVELVAPEPLTVQQLVEVHAPEYVEAVRTGTPAGLASSQGFTWDPGLWQMVLATNGGAVAAALTALKEGVSGSLSSGLHHAYRDHGRGFCTFNGLVLAAKAALAAGAGKVLILDLDAHAGGGTYSLIKDDPRIAQLDLTSAPFDSYTPENDRTVLRIAQDAPHHMIAGGFVMQELGALRDRGFRPDLVIYNAGMDPYTNVTDMARMREMLVFNALKGTPVAFVLAGGYLGPNLDQAGLVQLHRYTIEAAARSTT